jgi:hypothetical protein|tara:strand:- start:1645 stop:1854 length:210 start_codon:yes stop_codon:yes gene_type:complete
MMIWSELHPFQSSTEVKDAITRLSSISLNFHYLEYEEDIDALRQISQEKLIQELRKQGRLKQNSKHDLQ